MRFFLVILFFVFPLFGEDKPSMTAKEYLSTPVDRVFPIINRLNKEEAKILSNEILVEARKSYPQADQFYYLIQHIENIRSIEEEQSRLNSVLWVFGLAFALFFGFIGYLLRKMQSLEASIHKSNSSRM